MDSHNYGTPTDLYLVRIWRGRKNDIGPPGIHGKLQHVVSGESSYFGELSELPEALERMLGQRPDSVDQDAGVPTGIEPEDERDSWGDDHPKEG